MVRRLVEHEDVRLRDHQRAKNEARSFASGQRTDPLADVVAREEDATELPAHEARRFGGDEVPHDVERRRGFVAQHLAMVLRKVTDARLVPPLDVAAVGVEVPRRDLHQRRLAEPVGADDRHALAAPHDHRDAPEHLLRAVSLGDAVDGQHVAPALARRSELEERRAARARLELGDLDLLDLLQPTLRLPRLRGLRAEALHPGALLGDRRLGSRDLRLLAPPHSRLRRHERGVVPGVGGDRPVVHVQDRGRHGVEEPLVVRDDDGAPPGRRRGTARASGWRGCRGGSSARRGGRRRGRRRAPGRGGRAA